MLILAALAYLAYRKFRIYVHAQAIIIAQATQDPVATSNTTQNTTQIVAPMLQDAQATQDSPV